ncbi:GNAT family N-acetyltransferase [Aeromicrobium senzhongii]|uniref:GNAT family N-acetyltransferase n=1 Tax=Aeromicrobium senzhongii TaxID=2663859 RepID=A0ABX6SZ28_9ACTN|nr:GNAT family N-acetyltransferase [Aeromicrobium senzhongii]MTB87236.1 GNAT family N-acetyltransferase [Aeromicrobium senzhongii]QNL95694.1 GNAT family N-acetyltransferase [Aeromicrobium senzhongii]
MDEYTLIESAPDVTDYLHLRRASGLTPKSLEQARPAVAGGWAACHVRHSSGRTVAMGRVIGDGGWYFHIVDMAVLPDHQRRGLGDRVLSHLLDVIRRDAPPGAYVSLMADPPGRRLYERHGFVESAPHSVGMVLAPGT